MTALLSFGSLTPEQRGETGAPSTHERLAVATPSLSGAERLRLFEALPPWMQKFASIEQEKQLREARS